MDFTDEIEKTKAVIEALKPWMNFDLWREEEKRKNAPTKVSNTYFDDLRARGATEEDIQRSKALVKTQADQEPQTLVGDDGDDDNDDIRSIPIEK